MVFITKRQCGKRLTFTLLLVAGFYFAGRKLGLPFATAGSKVLKLDKASLKMVQSKTRHLKNGTLLAAPMFSDTVVSPHPFRFVLSNRDACGRNASIDSRVFLLILVKCRPEDSIERALLRKTWGGVIEVYGRRLLTMFLVGLSSKSSTNAAVVEENKRHGDIIQEDFIDHYKNLTYKTMMGWRWASEFCPDAAYVATADTDVLINPQNVVRRLVRMPRKRYAEGSPEFKAKPFRGINNTKWNTSLELYPEATYPPYYLGIFYVVSADVAADLFREAVHVRFLPWDDVYVGMVLKKIGMKLRRLPKYIMFERTDLKVDRALAQGPIVLIGNNTNHQRIKDNPERFSNIWGRFVKKQNDTTFKRKP